MNYFEIKDRVSQSRLKNILIHPRMYMSKNPVVEEDEKIHFVIGNGVDCLITEKDKFNDMFYVLSTKAPTGQIKMFIDKYYTLKDYDEAFTAVASAKYKLEWFKEKLAEPDNDAYYKALEAGKTILDPKTYETILSIVDSLNHFEEYQNLISPTGGKAVIPQLEILWAYNGLDMKSKLDFIVIDFDKKTILPIDVKTIGDSTMGFQYSFWKRRYDFQAASYRLALESWVKEEQNFSKLASFEILPFMFVVESSKYQGSPLMFEISPSTAEIGLNGGVVDGRTYEGFNQAIKRLIWHNETGVWDYTKEQWDSDKRILI